MAENAQLSAQNEKTILAPCLHDKGKISDDVSQYTAALIFCHVTQKLEPHYEAIETPEVREAQSKYFLIC